MPRPFAFPSFLRLSHDRDFQRILAEGRVIRLKTMIAHALPNDLPYPRLGLRVPGKIQPAPRRNRIKRWIREAFRHRKEELKGYDLVVRVLPQNPPSKYEEVVQALSQLIQHLKG